MGVYAIAFNDSRSMLPGTDFATADAHVDTEELRKQLADIRDPLSPLLEESGTRSLHLSSLEIALTLNAKGKVMFIAEAGLEASITLTFSRPDGT